MSARRKSPAFDPSRLDEIDDVLGAPLTPPGPPEPDWPRVTLGTAPAPLVPAPAAGEDRPAPTPAPNPAPPAQEPPTETDTDPAPPPRSEPSAGAAEPVPVSEPLARSRVTREAKPVARPREERDAEPSADRSRRDGPARRPTGPGGRPPRRPGERSAPAPMGKVPVAVRVPPQLYSDVNNDLLAGPERPSYGQLVIWALEDHPEEVTDAIIAARESSGGQRRPGGRRMAAADVQITLRLTPSERDFLDEHAQGIEPEDGKPVTRTEVAIACLRVALNRAD